MRLYFIFICIQILTSCQLYSQLIDNFSDGELLNNPVWNGDINDFIVNDQSQMQLNAADAGQSFIYSELMLPDSIRWSFEFNMDFAPSSSNRLRVVLFSDNPDLSIASGYIFEIGENGSDDAIHLLSLQNGATSTIASASMGSVGSDPAYARIVLEKTASDIWSLKVAYDQNDFVELEFEVNHDDTIFPAQGYFGFECTYTVSRIDAYYFDDISIGALLADTEAPVLTSVNSNSATVFELFFSEALDESTVNQLSNYFIPNVGNPENVNFDQSIPNKVIIDFGSQGIESGQKYNLTVSGITDLAGNDMMEANFPLCLIETADIGDLVINEILFDPYQEGEDFIEIYNKSSKFIGLQDLMLSNDSKDNDFEILQTDFVIEPESFVAISPDIDFLQTQYEPPASANLLQHNIPSMNNDDGNVSISNFVNGIEFSIDSFDYTEDLHFELLDDTEGVSLERKSYIVDTNSPENWQSAASSVNYATPGYANSNVISNTNGSEDMVSFDHQVFSPNGDGDKDQLVIRYQLNDSGFVGNIRIFDASGFFIRNLVSNELMQTEGFYTWSGLNEEKDKIMPVGMYIVYYQFFQTDGNVVEGKKVCVLADNL